MKQEEIPFLFSSLFFSIIGGSGDPEVNGEGRNQWVNSEDSNEDEMNGPISLLDLKIYVKNNPHLKPITGTKYNEPFNFCYYTPK